MGKILLFYKYIDITDPEAQLTWQRQLCQSLNLMGRIILANEGINGTLGGLDQSIDQYKQTMNNHPLFANIDFKASDGDSNYFPRLSIKVKKEIVHLGLDTKAVSAKDAGQCLTPEEAHALIAKQPQDLVLFDIRNDYESRVGTFQNALLANIQTFRELPAYINNNLPAFQDKQVLMFCTGDVRCERASAYLKLKNVAKAVYHIQGGIHRYVEKFPNGYFKGKNYVFDGRVALPVTEDILGQCFHCDRPYDQYTNCINAECNKQLIVCPTCSTSYHNTCSPQCLELTQSGKVVIRTKPHKVPIDS
jgi:predicted sulfurtransferase